MPEPRIEIETDASSSDRQIITNGLNAFNRLHVPADNYSPLCVFARSDSGKIIGGLLGETFWTSNAPASMVCRSSTPAYTTRGRWLGAANLASMVCVPIVPTRSGRRLSKLLTSDSPNSLKAKRNVWTEISLQAQSLIALGFPESLLFDLGRRLRSTFDKYLFESDPTLLRTICEHIAEILPQNVQILAVSNSVAFPSLRS